MALHTCLKSKWSHLLLGIPHKLETWHVLCISYLLFLTVGFLGGGDGFSAFFSPPISTNWHFHTWSWITIKKILKFEPNEEEITTQWNYNDNITRMTYKHCYANYCGRMEIPSPLSSFLRIGLAVSYTSPRRAPVHHCLHLHKTEEEILLARTHHYYTFKASYVLRKYFLHCLKRGHLSIVKLHQGKPVSLSTFGAWKPETQQRWFAKGHLQWLCFFWFINKLYTLTQLENMMAPTLQDSWFVAQKGKASWLKTKLASAHKLHLHSPYWSLYTINTTYAHGRKAVCPTGDTNSSL